jgi:hypothetical protein
MKNETLHHIAGFNNIQHILTNQSVKSTQIVRSRESSWLNRRKVLGTAFTQKLAVPGPIPLLPAVEHLNSLNVSLSLFSLRAQGP